MKQVYKITSSGSAVVSLGEAKSYLRVEHNTDDDLIESLVESAMEECNAFTWNFVTQPSVDITLTEVPDSTSVVLSRGPLAEVTAIEVFLEGGDSYTTLDPEQYAVDTAGQTIHFSETALTGLRSWSPVKIAAVVGPGEVTKALKLAVLQRVAETYENRETPSGLSEGTKRLLMPYKRISL